MFDDILPIKVQSIVPSFFMESVAIVRRYAVKWNKKAVAAATMRKKLFPIFLSRSP